LFRKKYIIYYYNIKNMSLADLPLALTLLGINLNSVSGGGDSSTWSTFPATQDVDIAHHNINNVNDLNLVNTTDPANIYTTTLVTSDSGELEVFAPSTSVHSNSFFVVGGDANASKIVVQNNSIIIGRDPQVTLSINSTGNLAVTSNEVTKDSDENSLATVKYVNGVGIGDASGWSTYPASQDVDMTNHALNNVSALNLVNASLTVNSTNNLATSVEVTKDSDENSLATLKYVNGLTGDGNASTWSTFDATQDVNMATFGLNNIGTVKPNGATFQIQAQNIKFNTTTKEGGDPGDYPLILFGGYAQPGGTAPNRNQGGSIEFFNLRTTTSTDSAGSAYLYLSNGASTITSTAAILASNLPSYILYCTAVSNQNYTNTSNGTITLNIPWPQIGGVSVCTDQTNIYITASIMIQGIDGMFVVNPSTTQSDLNLLVAQVGVLPNCMIPNASTNKIIFTCYGGSFNYDNGATGSININF
jgi:hypothetical protein